MRREIYYIERVQLRELTVAERTENGPRIIISINPNLFAQRPVDQERVDRMITVLSDGLKAWVSLKFHRRLLARW